MLAEINLALAYGARGLVYYLYSTTTDGQYGLLDASRNKTAQYDSLKTIHDNYQNTGQELFDIGTIFMNLTWQAGFSIHLNQNEPISSTYKLQDVISKIPGGATNAESETYVEVGVLQNGSTNHYMVVNRRCTSSETRELTVVFQCTANKTYRITDVYTGGTTTYYVGAGSTTFPYTLTLGPGQGKLLKLEDLGTFSGMWSGNVTANTAWVGSITVNTNVTVNSGVSLSVIPSSAIQFASGTSLTVNGAFVANSTDPTKRITFTGITATPGFWGGIKINPGSINNISMLRRCDVEYGTDGITITYTGSIDSVMVEKCRVRNNASAGIYINGNGYSGATVNPRIRSSSISANGGSGIDLANYAKPFVRFNRLESNGGSGICASSNSPANVDSNFISGNAEFGLWFAYSSSANLNRNTIQGNGGRGVYCFSNSNVFANGATYSKGRNKITLNTTVGIYSSSSSPNFGRDQSGSWGNNWIYQNGGNEAQQSGSGLLYAERCYWSGQQNQISGNVDVNPYLASPPDPVGWGQDPDYDPTYRIGSQPEMVAEAAPVDIDYSVSDLTSLSANITASTTSPIWTEELAAAIAKGLTTGEWSSASELITKLHRELQDGRTPNVDFVLVANFASKPEVASFIRKMLALVLVEKDLVESNVTTALAKLAGFGQTNPENGSELLANVGLIHLYRQNDLAGAQDVLRQLQARAESGDATAIEHVEAFGRILQDYRRRMPASDLAFQKGIAASASVAAASSATSVAIQNYPNPFNPETGIHFALPKATHVKVVIYNVAGQTIRRMADGEFPAGEHNLTWDGRNDSGRAAASGTYFLQIEAGVQNLTRKLLLLR